MSDKKALVPRLRFPEFQNTRGWEASSLGSFVRLRNGYAFKSAEYVDDGPYQIITIANVQQGKLTTDSTKRMVALPPDIQPHQILSLGDILISMTGNVGRICYATAEGLLLNQRVGKLVPEKINKTFLYQVLQREDFRSTMQLKAAGGAQGNLSAGDITDYVFSVPEVPAEQQKIADCLSSADELIAAQARKVDALKNHKKGLMQQLFPREDETQPRLRFTNGDNWILMGLPEVAFFQEGPGIMAVDFRSEGVPLVRLAGVDGSVVTLAGCNYLDPEKVKQKWAHFRLDLNDLLISTSATFGLSSIVTEVAAGAVFYTGLIRFKPRNDQLNVGYLKVYLGSRHFERQAESAAVGGGIKHFGPTHLKQMKIPLPPLEEQQRIASCLSSLDTLITLETQKLEALKTHKKGLMQQLFPSPEEVDA